MSELNHVILWRYAFVIVHAIAVGVILTFIVDRSTQPIAATDLPANYRLTRADLRVPETEPLVGKYLRAPIQAGTPVTPDLLGSQAMPPKPTTTLAAVVSIAATAAKQRGIVEGTSVSITRTSPPLQVPGTIVRRDCDDTMCVFVVSLPKLPSQTIDPDAFAGADLFPAPPKGP